VFVREVRQQSYVVYALPGILDLGIQLSTFFLAGRENQGEKIMFQVIKRANCSLVWAYNLRERIKPQTKSSKKGDET
jgi:hypothetical protein